MRNQNGAEIKVWMTFYQNGQKEVSISTIMPQVPCVGDTVHWSLSGYDDDSRAWEVKHVSWVGTQIGTNSHSWHAEIGLS
jgi:hypothetical protein